MFEHNRKMKAAGVAAVIIALVLFAAGSIRFQSVQQHQEGRTGFEQVQSETESASGGMQQGTEGKDGTEQETARETSGDGAGIFDDEPAGAVQTIPETLPEIQTGEEDGADSRKESLAQPEQITCFIEIRCDSAVAKKPEIQNPGLLASIPDDGIILAQTEYRVPKGTTVFELLAQAAVQYQIPIVANSKGTYISSINNLAEKMVGMGSGWTYRVNAKMVMKPASASVLAEGDVIQWIYVPGYE